MEDYTPLKKIPSHIFHYYYSYKIHFYFISIEGPAPSPTLCVLFFPLCCRMFDIASPSPTPLNPLTLESQHLTTNKSYFL